MNIHYLVTGKLFVFFPTDAAELEIFVMTPSITSLNIAAQTFLLFFSLPGFLTLLTASEKMREAHERQPTTTYVALVCRKVSRDAR